MWAGKARVGEARAGEVRAGETRVGEARAGKMLCVRCGLRKQRGGSLGCGRREAQRADENEYFSLIIIFNCDRGGGGSCCCCRPRPVVGGGGVGCGASILKVELFFLKKE